MGKCNFFKDGKCRVLVNVECTDKCKFRKTKAEFEAGNRYAKEILKEKGLVAYVHDGKQGQRVGVKEI